METWPHHIWNPFLQVDWHKGEFVVPPEPIPIPGASLHAGAGIFTMPLVGLGDAACNKCRVIADGTPIVSRGHECKYLIVPHANIWWPVPGINLEMPLLIIESSSACEFAVGSVQGEDGPIAVSLFKAVGLNWSCQEFGSAPTSAVVNWSSVVIGFTWGDLVASLVCALFDIIKGEIESAVIGAAAKWLGKRGLVKSQMDEELLKFTMEDLYSSVVGGPIGEATGLNEVLNSNPVTGLLTGETVTGDNGWANQLGGYIDGNAELMG